MFRFAPSHFLDILTKISPFLQPNKKFTSSPIDPFLKLALTLRFLAGAIYLDIALLFDIPANLVHHYVMLTLMAIDKCYDNINFPTDEETLNQIEAGFRELSNGHLVGTVGACDGVVFQMQRPDPKEVNNDVQSYFVRKGYYAFGMQAVCDSRCKFMFISAIRVSSTHDSSAFSGSELYQLLMEGNLPLMFHIVFDEAYQCSGQMLTPWKGTKLDSDKDSFNFWLSRQRQVIERAFGMLIQRWGVFWRPLRMKMKNIPLVIKVACKLHNLCVDHYESSRPSIDPTYLETFYGGEGNTDYQPGDHRSLTLVEQSYRITRGTRTDLEGSDLRTSITKYLKTHTNTSNNRRKSE